MTYKQKAERLAAKHGCTVDKDIPSARPWAWTIEISPPDGYTFGGLSVLVRHEWKDAYRTLLEHINLGLIELEEENEDNN